jgi:hypothetical protein
MKPGLASAVEFDIAIVDRHQEVHAQRYLSCWLRFGVDELQLQPDRQLTMLVFGLDRAVVTGRKIRQDPEDANRCRRYKPKR